MPEWITSFFTDETDVVEKLNLFGWEHFLLLGLTLLGGILLYRCRHRLRRWRGRERVRIVMAALYLVNMLVFYGVFLVKGIYDWHIHLPLHLCFLTNFAFIYILLTGNRRLFQIVFFFTWVGPLPAMLMPNTPMRFDRFLTYHFAISHHLLLLMGLYCLFVLGWQVEWRDVGRAFLAGNVVFLAVFAFNAVFGTNYIMTTRLPAHIIAMLPFLRWFDYPIVWLELCGLAGMCAAYLPVKRLRTAEAAASLCEPLSGVSHLKGSVLRSRK